MPSVLINSTHVHYKPFYAGFKSLKNFPGGVSETKSQPILVIIVSVLQFTVAPSVRLEDWHTKPTRGSIP